MGTESLGCMASALISKLWDSPRTSRTVEPSARVGDIQPHFTVEFLARRVTARGSRRIAVILKVLQKDSWMLGCRMVPCQLSCCASAQGGRSIVKDVCCPFAQETAHHHGGWLLSEGQCRRAIRGAFSITCHRIFAWLPYRALLNANRGRGAQLTACQRAQK
jgi:hypothetical protein